MLSRKRYLIILIILIHLNILIYCTSIKYCDSRVQLYTIVAQSPLSPLSPLIYDINSPQFIMSDTVTKGLSMATAEAVGEVKVENAEAFE